jgi:hypothetical protein
MAVGKASQSAQGILADRYDGSPSQQPGANSLFKRGVNVDVVAGASSAGMS